MELAVNGSLVDVLSIRKRIDELQARIWFLQLLDAVEYCHNLEIAHRDLKCE